MFGRINKELKKKMKEYKDQLLAEQREKEVLLSSKADFSLLEKLIKKSNENPNLKIEIFLNDGTRILMKTYEEHKPSASELINGDYLEIR